MRLLPDSAPGIIPIAASLLPGEDEAEDEEGARQLLPGKWAGTA